MKPLGLREIAEELGLHESTVSRVTNNKYMATPLGVFELKFFFSRALATSEWRGLLDNGDPWRDQGDDRGRGREQPAVRRAHRAPAVAPGPQVARRTVTKYRQMMKVPPYEARRRDRRSGTAR